MAPTAASASPAPLAGALWQWRVQTDDADAHARAQPGWDLVITRADGQALETRNRVTLCRCGASSNKPLCDGSHKSANFVDPVR